MVGAGSPKNASKNQDKQCQLTKQCTVMVLQLSEGLTCRIWAIFKVHKAFLQSSLPQHHLGGSRAVEQDAVCPSETRPEDTPPVENTPRVNKKRVQTLFLHKDVFLSWSSSLCLFLSPLLLRLGLRCSRSHKKNTTETPPPLRADRRSQPRHNGTKRSDWSRPRLSNPASQRRV